MSESDIRSQCPEPQASTVLRLIDSGWEFEKLDDGDVQLRTPGHKAWVRPDGSVYPLTN